MQLKINQFFSLFFASVFLIGLLPVRIFADTETAESKVLITQVVLADGSDPEEYIGIYNQTAEDIELDGWYLEYAKNDFNETSCDLPAWDMVEESNSGFSLDLSGLTLTAKSSLAIGHQLNNSGSGSVRIVEQTDSMNVTHDLVGWGVSAPCYEGEAAEAPTISKSIQRKLDCETNLPVDTNNNNQNFKDPMILTDDCEKNTDSGSDGGMGGGPGSESENSCGGVIISEILPNPSGVDSGNEFIELHNPTDKNISLEGCKLQTTANSNMYTFVDIELSPDEYQAFTNDLTGLVLNNSSGGSVYLVNTDNSEQEVEYLSDLDDDVAWALNAADNTWSITYTATPGSKNKIVKVKPCPKGYFRNQDTNRCNKITVKAGLGPCPAGKFRNPDTNRCKSILAASSQPKPCGSGQFRNPATNRCKSLSSSRALVPCRPDQERNPETNRCRKVSSDISKNNEIKDVLSVSDTKDQTSWAMAGFSFAGASSYAVWEWRNEMLEKLLMLKNKLGMK